ncbi:hypothetical protein MMC14_010595 [Varicellaria rhodocarpa]|nr:hypothetical protein [Varicellaria rhodocarpa]
MKTNRLVDACASPDASRAFGAGVLLTTYYPAASVKAWSQGRLQTLTKLCRGAQTATAVSRRDEYTAITDRDIAYFRDVLGERGVVTDPDALEPLNK